jgi:hypothetical protein
MLIPGASNGGAATPSLSVEFMLPYRFRIVGMVPCDACEFRVAPIVAVRVPLGFAGRRSAGQVACGLRSRAYICFRQLILIPDVTMSSGRA